MGRGKPDFRLGTIRTVNPHCSQSLCLPVCFWLKFIYNPKINACITLVVMLRVVKNLSRPCACSQLITNQATLRLLVSALILGISVLLAIYLVPCFLHFHFFPVVIFLFKVAPSIVPKCCLVFPEHKKAMLCTVEKYIC